GADVYITRHQCDARREITSATRHRTWHYTNFRARVVFFQRDFVKVFKWADFVRCHLRNLKIKQYCMLHPFVYNHLVVNNFRYTNLTCIKALENSHQYLSSTILLDYVV